MTLVVDQIISKTLAITNRRGSGVSRIEFSRRIKFTAGDLKGISYDPNSDPIQRYIIEQLDRMDGDRRVWERIYWCAVPQFAGKTVVGIIQPALFGVIQEQLPVGYALPTLKDIDKAWHTKIHPQIKTSGFGDHLPTHGPGSRGGRGHVVQFENPRSGEIEGSIMFCTPGAYGDTVAVMLVDEVDQFRKDNLPDIEGLEDLWNRTNAYRGRALRVAVGTIEWDENSTILALVDQGTKTSPWLRCPHCERHQLLDPVTQLVWEGDDDTTVRESARLVCKHCATKWTEQDRQHSILNLRMVHAGQDVDAKGVITGPEPRTTALSILEDAFVCPHARLPELAREDWLSKKAEAKGNYGLRRKYSRYRLLRPYEQPVKGGEISNKVLSERFFKNFYGRGEVPGWVRFLTVGSDVQKDRHYWIVIGHGVDRRWCVIDWGFDFLHPSRAYSDGYEPTPDDRIRVLDTIAVRCREGWPRQGNPAEMLVPVWCGIDTGYLPEELYPWIASQPDWVACKGVGSTQDGKHDVAKPEGASVMPAIMGDRLRGLMDITEPKSTTIQLWHIYGSQVRQQVHSGLLRGYGSAASGELPCKLPANESLLLHLTSEIWAQDERGRWYWRRVRKGNHLLDGTVYAVTLGWFESEYRDLYPPTPPAPRGAAPETPDNPPPTFPSPRTTPDGRPWSLLAR